MTGPELELRDKEQLILQQIQQGNDDIQKITSASTLENHHVNYAFEKLEDHGLIQISKPEGTVERIINGQKRVFQHPKTAELTDKGRHHLEAVEEQELTEYEDLTHGELVEKVHDLEDQVEELEQKFEVFREQVQRNFN